MTEFNIHPPPPPRVGLRSGQGQGHTAADVTAAQRHPGPEGLRSMWGHSPSSANTQRTAQGTQDSRPCPLPGVSVLQATPLCAGPSHCSHLARPSSSSGATPSTLPEPPQTAFVPKAWLPGVT